MNKVIIIIEGGCLRAVYGTKDQTYELIDLDNLKCGETTQNNDDIDILLKEKTKNLVELNEC